MTACECWPTPESEHFVYYGATEPGSAMEWNPDCPVHPPTPVPDRATTDYQTQLRNLRDVARKAKTR